MYNVQCTGKNVIFLHDNESMKPWLMGPNLSFTISRCQNRMQGNKVTVQYFGAMLNCHNAKQGLMFVSNIYRKNYEISINAYTYMHIDIYICIYICIYAYTCALKSNGLENKFTISMPVITMLNLTLGSAAITDECVFWMILWSRLGWFWIR